METTLAGWVLASSVCAQKHAGWVKNVVFMCLDGPVHRFRKSIQRSPVPSRLFSRFFQPTPWGQSTSRTAGARLVLRPQGVGWKKRKKSLTWYWRPLYVFSKPLYNRGRAHTVRLLYDEPHSHGLDSVTSAIAKACPVSQIIFVVLSKLFAASSEHPVYLGSEVGPRSLLEIDNCTVAKRPSGLSPLPRKVDSRYDCRGSWPCKELKRQVLGQAWLLYYMITNETIHWLISPLKRPIFPCSFLYVRNKPPN